MIFEICMGIIAAFIVIKLWKLFAVLAVWSLIIGGAFVAYSAITA